jgi:hypothetical protein
LGTKFLVVGTVTVFCFGLAIGICIRSCWISFYNRILKMPPKMGGAPKCPRCGKSVFFAERATGPGGDWHKVPF